MECPHRFEKSLRGISKEGGGRANLEIEGVAGAVHKAAVHLLEAARYEHVLHELEKVKGCANFL